MSVAHRSFRGTLAGTLLGLVLAGSAHGAVVLNEIRSEGVDAVELQNTGAAPVDIGGYVITDSNPGNAFTVPPGTVIAAGGYYVVDTLFFLGSSDSARLVINGDLADVFSWTEHAAATWGRCPDGTGDFGQTSAATFGAANACLAPAAAWPGGADVATADPLGTFGSNLSGLAYEPGVLWAVQNGPSMLHRLRKDGTTYRNDTANGWSNGKTLRFPDGAGVPDAEGITLTDEADAVYVSIERDDSAGNDATSRPDVLRYDVSDGATTLTATQNWNLAGDVPGLPANAGLEGLAWVPDDVLVAKGFRDEATGGAYAPATYPGHGNGLFFAGVEGDGRVLAYALRPGGAFTRVATIPSGLPKVMALEFERESGLLWAVCDDSCDGRSHVLDVGPGGAFAVAAAFARPGGMANLNNEGFALAPQAECVNGLKPAFWADDATTGGHAIRVGSRSCTVPAPPGGGTGGTGGTGGSGGADGTTPPAVPAPVPPVAPPAVTPQGDLVAPRLTLAALTRAGLRSIRRTGRFTFSLLLGEGATLRITATARRSTRAKARTLIRTTRRSVRAGRRSFTLTLSRKVRRALRKRELVTVTIAAADPAGNTTTRRVTARVP